MQFHICMLLLSTIIGYLIRNICLSFLLHVYKEHDYYDLNKQSRDLITQPEIYKPVNNAQNNNAIAG